MRQLFACATVLVLWGACAAQEVLVKPEPLQFTSPSCTCSLKEREELGHRFTTMLKMSGVYGRVDLEMRIREFDPFVLPSAGVFVGPRLFRKNGNVAEWRVRVTDVWIGSPADASGILPGDWVEQIDDHIVPTATYENLDIARQAQAFISKSLKPTVHIKVRRGAAVLAYDVTKRPLGADLRSFFEEKRDQWIAQLDSLTPQIEALRPDIVAVQNQQQLDMMTKKLILVFAVLQTPRVTLEMFIARHMKSLEPSKITINIPDAR